MKDIVKKLAEASDWAIPEDRLEEIAQMYKATMEDTRPVRELELGSSLPADIGKSWEPALSRTRRPKPTPTTD